MNLQGTPHGPLTAAEIGSLLIPYLQAPSSTLLDRLAVYLEVLLRWNARTNLTSLRSSKEMVTRHFGESLFAGSVLRGNGTLLDFGSGAGFPGLPIALLRPDFAVTLAESQHKKSSFLREIVRKLAVPVEVLAGRVEDLPPECHFDAVCLRAVDRMEVALPEAGRRARNEVLVLTSVGEMSTLSGLVGFGLREVVPIPCSRERVVAILERGLFHGEQSTRLMELA